MTYQKHNTANVSPASRSDSGVPSSTKQDQHLIFGAERFSAFCEVCKAHTDRPHVIGLAVFCAACCPECNVKPPAERTGDVVTLKGEQTSIFK